MKLKVVFKLVLVYFFFWFDLIWFTIDHSSQPIDSTTLDYPFISTTSKRSRRRPSPENQLLILSTALTPPPLTPVSLLTTYSTLVSRSIRNYSTDGLGIISRNEPGAWPDPRLILLLLLLLRSYPPSDASLIPQSLLSPV